MYLSTRMRFYLLFLDLGQGGSTVADQRIKIKALRVRRGLRGQTGGQTDERQAGSLDDDGRREASGPDGI
jgi:hypothetical protein